MEGRGYIIDYLVEENPQPLPSEEIKRRTREKAELLAEFERSRPRPTVIVPTPVATETEPPPQRPLTGRITADGRKLAGLMSKAKKLETKAESDSERANASRQAAHTARLELNNYMTQHGLA